MQIIILHFTVSWFFKDLSSMVYKDHKKGIQRKWGVKSVSK
jgi:hypothetical protein